MKTILVPIDFSDATFAVVEAACGLAAAFHAKLALLHVGIAPAASMVAFDRLSLVGDSPENGQLQDWRDKLINDGYSVESVVRYGDPADCIRHEAKRIGADYIVIGSHGHGALFELILGSTVRRLLRDVPCSVLLVPIAPKKIPTLDCGAEPGAHAKDPFLPVATD